MAALNPFETRIEGDALNSKGFEAFKTVEGLGLNTFGFLWPLEGIWMPGEDIPTTVWTDCADCVGGGVGA